MERHPTGHYLYSIPHQSSVYGETEYWMALIKVVTVIVFLGVGVLTIFGILGGQAIGFSNFTLGDAPFWRWLGG